MVGRIIQNGTKWVVHSFLICPDRKIWSKKKLKSRSLFVFWNKKINTLASTKRNIRIDSHKIDYYLYAGMASL